jgi:hypothetical protein
LSYIGVENVSARRYKTEKKMLRRKFIGQKKPSWSFSADLLFINLIGIAVVISLKQPCLPSFF